MIAQATGPADLRRPNLLNGRDPLVTDQPLVTHRDADLAAVARQLEKHPAASLVPVEGNSALNGPVMPDGEAKPFAEYIVDSYLAPSHPDAEPPIDVAEVLARTGGRYLTGISTAAPDPLLIDRLDPTGHTILYGTGGSGKGTLTSWWIVQLHRAGHRVLVLDYENHPEEWARRINGLGGPEALEAVAYVSPRSAGWKGAGGPIWQQKGDLRELAQALGATYLVVDSIVPASAADPLKPETPAAYAAALEYIGLPTLSLGHVTKMTGLAYPFGSVFWHNLCRFSWSLAQDGERVNLVNRKHNNYQKAPRQSVTTTWVEGIPGEVWEQPYSVVLSELIDEALGTDSMLLSELVTALNTDRDPGEEQVKSDSVYTALRRGMTADPKRFTVTGQGKAARWSKP